MIGSTPQKSSAKAEIFQCNKHVFINGYFVNATGYLRSCLLLVGNKRSKVNKCKT